MLNPHIIAFVASRVGIDALKCVLKLARTYDQACWAAYVCGVPVAIRLAVETLEPQTAALDSAGAEYEDTDLAMRDPGPYEERSGADHHCIHSRVKQRSYRIRRARKHTRALVLA